MRKLSEYGSGITPADMHAQTGEMFLVFPPLYPVDGPGGFMIPLSHRLEEAMCELQEAGTYLTADISEIKDGCNYRLLTKSLRRAPEYRKYAELEKKCINEGVRDFSKAGYKGPFWNYMFFPRKLRREINRVSDYAEDSPTVVVDHVRLGKFRHVEGDIFKAYTFDMVGPGDGLPITGIYVYFNFESALHCYSTCIPEGKAARDDLYFELLKSHKLENLGQISAAIASPPGKTFTVTAQAIPRMTKPLFGEKNWSKRLLVSDIDIDDGGREGYRRVQVALPSEFEYAHLL
jgi:hypothetical protein